MPPEKMSPQQALRRLAEGNQRFAAASRESEQLNRTLPSHQSLLEQTPFAIILGCSDSRVPAEIVFDQGLGDLFVIRVAGNIVAPSQIGSIEFAVEKFGTNLVVVLGHSLCGAISATVDSLLETSDDLSPNLASIVNRVKPAVEPLVKEHKFDDVDTLLHDAMQANVQASLKGLVDGSQIIQRLVEQQELLIVGAEYSVETGVVDFYDSL